MTAPTEHTDDTAYMKRALEVVIRIGLLLLLGLWCFEICRPFLIPIVWGIIIAVALAPLYVRLRAFLGDRAGVASFIFAVLALVVILVPTFMLADTLVDTALGLSADFSDGSITIPPPPKDIGQWVFVGDNLEELWKLASENMMEALREVAPQIRAVGRWLLGVAAGTGFGILQFILAVIIAAVLLAHDKVSKSAAGVVAHRLSGERGVEFTRLAMVTVRSVARGIIGIALIQSMLAGLGFMVVGIPAAGFLALICLILGIIQIGVMPVIVPSIIYVFSTADTTTAVIFMIWSLCVMFMDNVLRPIVLGRGVPVPMLIIFIGAIGGFLLHGIIGLFIGPVVLAVSYKLFLAWLQRDPQPETVTPTGP